jgi:Domain of unknown function (DUF4349)
MTNLRCVSWRSISICMLLISGSLILNGCGSASENKTTASVGEVAKPLPSGDLDGLTGSSNSKVSSRLSESKVNTQAQPTTPIPQKPQLVKTAELSLRLESIDKMMVQLRRIVQSKQGDIYNFQDDRPQGSGEHHQATLILKVPSTTLDATLSEIMKLGRVESQGIKSEDVTQQLVDTDARLKNLRQQEDLTRRIMDRSGSVRDILAVSKELSVIREQIEKLDASVKNLRQQVAYSTINLKIEETQSASPTSDAFGVQVGETWKNSTHAAGSLGTNLALGLLWLLPFTPFIAIGAGGVYYAIRRRRRQLSAVVTSTNEE